MKPSTALFAFLTSTLVAAAPTPSFRPDASALQELVSRWSSRDGSVDGAHSVTLIFDADDNGTGRSLDHVVHMPLNKRVPTRRADNQQTLPTHPSRARILRTLTARTTRYNPVFEVEQSVAPSVACTAHPKVEEEAYTWTTADGAIDFEDEGSAWYLDGREVESYECRLI